jgi:hypothetical protein
VVIGFMVLSLILDLLRTFHARDMGGWLGSLVDKAIEKKFAKTETDD